MEKFVCVISKFIIFAKQKGKRELFPVDGMIFKPYIIKNYGKEIEF